MADFDCADWNEDDFDADCSGGGVRIGGTGAILKPPR